MSNVDVNSGELIEAVLHWYDHAGVDDAALIDAVEEYLWNVKP